MDQLTYIGHATTLLRLGGVSILTDPMLRSGLGPLRRQGPSPGPEVAESAGLVLLSHLHRDHLDLSSLRRVPAEVPAVVPRGAGHWVTKGGPREIVEVGVGETVAVAEVEITGVPAVHDGYRDLHVGPQIEAMGHLIRREGRTVYFAGDTDLFPEMSELEPTDLALVPVWGWGPSVGDGHLDPAKAARALQLIRPRLAVPIHWGTFYPLGLRRFRPEPLSAPPREFARIAGRLAPGVEVRILEPGSAMDLEA
jgi:L-ascorbate metabolism protein UlaG (beta-lactamase superfamily)